MRSYYDYEDSEVDNEVLSDLVEDLNSIIGLSKYVCPTEKLPKKKKEKTIKNIKKTLKCIKHQEFGKAPYLSQDIRDGYYEE